MGRSGLSTAKPGNFLGVPFPAAVFQKRLRTTRNHDGTGESMGIDKNQEKEDGKAGMGTDQDGLAGVGGINPSWDGGFAIPLLAQSGQGWVLGIPHFKCGFHRSAHITASQPLVAVAEAFKTAPIPPGGLLSFGGLRGGRYQGCRGLLPVPVALNVRIHEQSDSKQGQSRQAKGQPKQDHGEASPGPVRAHSGSDFEHLTKHRAWASTVKPAE